MADLSSLDTSKHREELLALRAKRASKLKYTQFFGVLLAVVSVIVLITGLIQYRGEVSESPEWLAGEILREEQFHNWLSQYGVPLERLIYSQVSELIHKGSIIVLGDTIEGTFDLVSISFFRALQKISFLLIASFRILFAGALLGVAIGYYRRKAYRGEDLLGVTGNERLFFSGIKTTLDDVHEEKLIPGLACPPRADKATIETSELYKILKTYDAVNETTTALAGILLAHPEWPGSLPNSPDGKSSLDKFIEPLSLPAYASLVLNAALRVHSHHASSELVPHEGKHSAISFERFVEKSLNRVLTPQQKRKIEQTPPATIAAAILALEAGKVLAFVKEGSWIRKSRFQQLAARAVIHSLPMYSKDFIGDERTTIRRALIYASRLSVLGPVRFPLDLSDDAGALRQWTEVLLSPPHEIEAASDEVECYGYVSEGQKQFAEHFFRAVGSMDHGLLEGALATENGCFFEFSKLLNLIRRAIPEPHRKRIVELSALLGTRARVGTVGATDVTMESAPPAQTNMIIPAPLTLRELTEISHSHGLSIDDVQEWAGLRSILLSYGWLSRRVGQSLVPEHSVIFGVFKSSESSVSKNDLGLFVRKGIIAIRASRLEAQFSKSWGSRFMFVDSAEAAETPEQVEKLLRGEEEVEHESLSS